ncbi:lipase 3-like [Thrips palmi]|uniref:Lipase n=1 Tax=Thrips palmi TaxID=161013 RepID=A0A6P8YH55_THRPL|nr:lipase 3-like [Thrips palmi]
MMGLREDCRFLFLASFLVTCGTTLAQGPLPRTPSDILKSNGYPSEVHHVTTEDGYILQLDRIPQPGKPVVYLANQLVSSAAAYLILGKGKSIGFLLYDAGFDVWLSNFRGTNFSLTHKTLSSSDDKFWEFGWHEHGTLDNPALIDYIVATTKQPSVVFMGHSMGATTFFVTASERPDTLKKISAAFVMGPASFLAHHRNPALSIYHPVANITQRIADLTHHHRQPVEFIRSVIDRICNSARRLNQELCRLAGLSPDDRILSDIGIFFPAGGSLGQILHYAQLGDRKWPGFRKYNYGTRGNRARYGQDTPPDYNLANINTPIFMYYGQDDSWCTEEDMALLRSNLKNVRKSFIPLRKNFKHRDFVLSDTAYEDVWKEVLKDLDPYLRQS